MKRRYPGLEKRRPSGLSLFSSELLSSHGEVVHGFLTRLGGFSEAPFDSLNLDPRDGDSLEDIRKNTEKIADAFGLNPLSLTLPRQVHGSSVYALDKALSNPLFSVEADAIVTGLADTPIGILTADCVPILMFDPKRKAIAAAHAGWRGTAKGIAAEVVYAMKNSYKTNPADIIAAIGPHIRECCYSIGPDVAGEFKKTFGSMEGLVCKEKNASRLNLAEANARVLEGAGVQRKNIPLDPPCTSCRVKDFFSYRGQGPRTGRQLSFIMLRKG
ncbi:MAG: peptidoglycan editing factor PgeF [Deltaproteobacteria bacterium]